MSDQIKTLVTDIVNEEGERQFGSSFQRDYVTPAYSALVEAVADRVADAVETKAQELVERVEANLGEGQRATDYLTEFGFITEPEPEVEDEPADDVTTEALDSSRLSALEAFVEEIRPLVKRAKAYLGV